MIEIDNVILTPREGRPLQRGWGLVHWVILVPQYAPIIALLGLTLTVQVLAGSFLPPLLAPLFFLSGGLIWYLGWIAYRRVMAHEGAKAPTGALPWRWTLEDSGISVTSEPFSSRIDWRALKEVREESDRFLFLLTPQNNSVLPKRLMTNTQITELRALVRRVDSGRLAPGVD